MPTVIVRATTTSNVAPIIAVVVVLVVLAIVVVIVAVITGSCDTGTIHNYTVLLIWL